MTTLDCSQKWAQVLVTLFPKWFRCKVTPVPEYNLTVVNGYGSGKYKAGQNIAITAIVPTGRVFRVWASDGCIVSGVESPNAVTSLRDRDASVTATFKDIPPEDKPIPGDPQADGGEELFDNADGMGLRVDANCTQDTGVPSGGDFYFISGELIRKNNALRWFKDQSGTWQFEARDFRGNTGILYRYVGHKLYTSTSKLYTERAWTIHESACRDVSRTYWRTVEG